jgi:hypothetical protein
MISEQPTDSPNLLRCHVMAKGMIYDAATITYVVMPYLFEVLVLPAGFVVRDLR